MYGDTRRYIKKKKDQEKTANGKINSISQFNQLPDMIASLIIFKYFQIPH